MGSGGVGAYVGSRLQAAGESVVFIARGAHLAALQKDGLRLESPVHPLHLPSFNAVQEPSMVGPETRVLTLQNGIDSVDLITPHVAGAKVRGGVIYVSAVIDRPGVIRSPGGLHMIVADAAHGDLVMADFFAACARATALDAKPSDAIAVTLWEKFIALTSLSGTTALLRASMGQILAHPETRMLQRQLVDEAVAVGRAAGQVSRTDLADEIMVKLAAMPYAFRSSMAEDLARGKPLELRWLSGRVHALGLEYGVPTPGHSAVYRGLVLYEDGKPVDGQVAL